MADPFPCRTPAGSINPGDSGCAGHGRRTRFDAEAVIDVFPPLFARIKLRQLQLVLALVETGNLHRAAALLGLSQPAATKLLKDAEALLKVSLFERLPRGVQPTVFGAALARYASLIMGDVRNLHHEIENLRTGSFGHIHVGAVSTAVPGLLTPAIAKIAQRHPSLSINLRIDTSDQMLEALDMGRLDVVIGRPIDRRHRSDFSYEALEEELVSFVSGPDNPLAEQPTLAALAEAPWVLWPPSSPLRRLVEAVFEHAGLPLPHHALETSSMLLATSVIQRTGMVAILPTPVAEHFASAGIIRILPITPAPRLGTFGIIMRRERLAPPAVTTFLDVLREIRDGKAGPNPPAAASSRKAGAPAR